MRLLSKCNKLSLVRCVSSCERFFALTSFLPVLSSEELRQAIASLISDRPTRTHTGRFVDLCYRIALAYLRQKQRSGRLNPDLLGLPPEDLAMDGIADLFERDDAGRFPRLAAYFEHIGHEEVDDQTLFEATRRLVFSKVNDTLFHAYGEADASLANLLRSLKRAIKERPDLVLERRSGVLWVQVKASEPRAHPLAPPEFLEAHLTPAIRQRMTTGDVLHAAVGVLAAQAHYVQRYPLTLLARVIRSATVRVNEAADTPSDEPASLYREDVARLIERSVAATQSAMRVSYVGKGKVDEATYALYFRAIQDRLNDSDLTNYEALRAYLPELSREAYEQRRAVFEYLSKSARNRLMHHLRKEG